MYPCDHAVALPAPNSSWAANWSPLAPNANANKATSSHRLPTSDERTTPPGPSCGKRNPNGGVGGATGSMLSQHNKARPRSNMNLHPDFRHCHSQWFSLPAALSTQRRTGHVRPDADAKAKFQCGRFGDSPFATVDSESCCPPSARAGCAQNGRALPQS